MVWRVDPCRKHLWRQNHNDKPVRVRRIFSRSGSVKSSVPNFKFKTVDWPLRVELSREGVGLDFLLSISRWYQLYRWWWVVWGGLLLLRVSFFVFLLRRHQFLGSSERKLMVIIEKDSGVNVAWQICPWFYLQYIKELFRARSSEVPWVIYASEKIW